MTKNVIVMEFSESDLELICEALDSHRYWQLSDEEYRDSGYVSEPGSTDPDMAKEIQHTEQLEDRIREELR